MKTVNQDDLNAAYRFIESNSDPLYRSLFEYHFQEGSAKNVLSHLQKYQNDDGGFGHGLEPDFLLPLSSPMATTIAFQIMDDVDLVDGKMISATLGFYEKTFDEKRKGWWAVPAQVNEHPHAPWWHYDTKERCTVIDKHWGNPSAEILGTLYQYRDQLNLVDIEKLIEYAIDHLNGLKEYSSEHEIYCYLRMYPKLSKKHQEQLRESIAKAIKALVCLDTSQWHTYVPKPLDFIQTKEHPLFGEIEAYVEENCDYLGDTMKEGLWHPTWAWGQYEEAWEKSRKNWIAALTIRNYRTLRGFGRFE